jgi:hypothetical protein
MVTKIAKGKQRKRKVQVMMARMGGDLVYLFFFFARERERFLISQVFIWILE